MNDGFEIAGMPDLDPEAIAEYIAQLSEDELDQLMSMIEGSTMANVAAIEGKPRTALADILQLLEDDELKLICEMHGLHLEPFDVERAPREKLEERAALLLTHPSLQEATMLDMPQSVRDDYLEIMRTGSYAFPLEGSYEESENAHLRGLLDALASMMIVFPFAHEASLSYIVPIEIRESCESVATEAFFERAAEIDLIYQYIDAAINLYGGIQFDELSGIIDRHIPEGLKHGDARAYVQDIVEREGVWAYFEDEGIVAHEIFHDAAGLGYGFVRELLSHAATKPRYIPGKQEFLAYADPNYFEENFEAELLTELLAGFFSEPLEHMEDTVAYVQECARQGVRNKVLIETLFEEFLPGPFANEAQANLAVKQVAKLVHTTRTWACNGHTPEEIARIEA